MKKNDEIRLAKTTDKAKIKSLWKYCFADTQEFIDYYFENRFVPSDTLCIFENGNLTASLQMNPYNLVVGRDEFETRYIVGVSVAPEHRGLGKMSVLMKNTLNFQFEKGQYFSILMPIDTNIYTRYGYVNCYHQSEFVMELSRISTQKSPYLIQRADIQNLTKKQISELTKLYNFVMKNEYSYIRRNEKYWKNKVAELSYDGGELFVVYDRKTPKGYVQLISKTPSRVGHALELVFADSFAYYSLMTLIKSHSTQFEKVRIVTPQVDKFAILSSFDNAIEQKVRPFMMGRVINAKTVLEKIFERENYTKSNSKFIVKISDEQIAQNNFSVVYENGRLSTIDKNKDKLPLLSMSVVELCMLYTKSVKVGDLVELGQVQLSNCDLDFVEKIFGKDIFTNYLNDYI